MTKKKNLTFTELRQAIAERSSEFDEDSPFCWCYYACDADEDDMECVDEYNSCFVYTSKSWQAGPTKVSFSLNNHVIQWFHVKPLDKLNPVDWNDKEIIGLTEDWLKDYLDKLVNEYKEKKEQYLLYKAQKDFE